MWLEWDLRNLYFPDPVFLKRFAAARHVLILGILSSPVPLLQFLKYDGGIKQKSTIYHHTFIMYLLKQS
jgi:hypothetical protein